MSHFTPISGAGAATQGFPPPPRRNLRSISITEENTTYSADYPYRGPKKLFSGGAGLVSTAADYLRFCQMMLDGGKAGTTRLISRKSVELMTQDQLGKIGTDQGFGLGFGVYGVKAPLSELGSPGEFAWGGFYPNPKTEASNDASRKSARRVPRWRFPMRFQGAISA